MNPIVAVYELGSTVYLMLKSPTGDSTDSITFSTSFLTEKGAQDMVSAMQKAFNIPNHKKENQNEYI